MKKLTILFIACIAIFCVSCSASSEQRKASEKSSSTVSQSLSLAELVEKDTIVAAMIVHGRNSRSSPSVAYMLLASGKVLRFAKAVTTTPFTFDEAKFLLEAMAQEKLAYKSQDPRINSVVATLMAQGRNSSSSPSVAYALLDDGTVLRFAKAVTTTPFTLEQAKILLKSKSQEKLAYKPQKTSNSSVVATLIAQGRNSDASPSVAYALLADNQVLCFTKAVTTAPFTMEQAKILLEAKVKGKIVYNASE